MQESVRISIRLLGRFAVAVAGTPGSELRISSRKASALLAYLAMHPDRRASREHLATFLWGDRRDEHARQSLRQCLLSLRRDLAKAPVEILTADSNTVGLQFDAVTVDAAEFMTLADSSDAADLERAATLYRGEFLADFNLEEPFDDWVSKTRNQFDSTAANVFIACAKLADVRGDGKQALRAVERLIALDALREDWQRLALRIYAQYQGRERALAHADAVVSLLKVELGVDPEPATLDAIDSIRRDAVPLAPLEPVSPRPDATAAAANRVAIAPVSARATHAFETADGTEGLSGFAARTFNRMRHASLGTTSSIVIAALISVSAIVLMVSGQKAPTGASGAVISASDAGLVRIPLASANALKTAIKPLATPPGLVPIVVLPFAADDGDDGPGQKAADALTDDLISTLSRFAVMRVISRQTAFTYRGRVVDVADVGAELGVRYAVEGNFRTVGSKVSVNVQLVDTADRLQIWSDRIEWDASERFAIQDDIATRVARELKTGVTIAEGARSADNHAQEPDVDALVMQGLALYYRAPSRESLTKELALFEEALRREPDLQPAMVGVAMALTTSVLNSLADDPQRNLERADQLLDRALERSPNSYQAHCWKGMVYKARGDYPAALRSLTKCIDINPSATVGHSQIAEIMTRLGRAKDGLDYIQYAIRLSPKDPGIGSFYVVAGQAELELHHDDAAAEWFRRAIDTQPRNPSGYLYLAATCALMGDKENAARYWNEFRNLSAPPALGDLMTRLRSDVGGGAQELRSRLEQGLKLVAAS